MINQKKELDHSPQLAALASVMSSLRVWPASTKLLELQYKNSISVTITTYEDEQDCKSLLRWVLEKLISANVFFPCTAGHGVKLSLQKVSYVGD